MIANDQDHFRLFFKVLTQDGDNSKQAVTDIYNMLVNPRVASLYPEIFAETATKRQETMSTFTTATGVKMLADTVGTDQRGALQEDARPDMIWFDDFETRKTLRSARETRNIWENMEEARTSLAKGGGCIYTCNYISELGNVHTLVTKEVPGKTVLIVPIERDGVPTWSYYNAADIEHMRLTDEDFEGERMCKPSASKDVIFDRERLEAMPKRTPERVVADFRMYRKYDPSHRLGSGHDVAGGVGLDSSTSVFIDFSPMPAQVAATFASNTIKPDTFGDEVHREGEYYGNPIAGIEKNNHGHATIARARQLGVQLLKTPRKVTKVEAQASTEYGWHTNALTLPQMIFALAKAVADGLLELNDPRLIAEAMAYSRNDLIDGEDDPRLTTRHFDLLIAAAIAWQMKDYATVEPVKNDEPVEEDKPLYPDIGM